MEQEDFIISKVGWITQMKSTPPLTEEYIQRVYLRFEIMIRFLQNHKFTTRIILNDGDSVNDETEIKISYKKENADFIENKMSAERAEQLLGDNWSEIIKKSTIAIHDKFEERMLIYKNKFRRTEKGAITLGWKFELLNKKSGDLSGKMLLTEEQVIDVYAGNNLSDDKRNAVVCGQVIEGSGIANYILMDESVQSAQDVIDKMVPIRDYVLSLIHI